MISEKPPEKPSDSYSTIKISIIILIIVLITTFGYYLYYMPSNGELTGDMSEDEFFTFITNVNESNNNISSYKMDMDVNASSQRENVNATVTADVNMTSNEARLTYNIIARNQNSGNNSSVKFTTYLNETNMYMKKQNGENKWMKQSHENISISNPLDQSSIWNISKHSNSKNMYDSGDVTVNINDEKIIVKTPLTSKQMKYMSDANIVGLDLIDGTALNNIEIIEVYNSKTYTLQRYELRGSVSQRGQTLDVYVNGKYDYNNSPSSIIPSEVHNESEYGEIDI